MNLEKEKPTIRLESPSASAVHHRGGLNTGQPLPPWKEPSFALGLSVTTDLLSI